MSPVSTNAYMGVMESPSHYLAPAVPVVPSAVSYARVSPGRDREVSSSLMLDVFIVYEKSPDTLYYLPATSPVTPPFSEGSLPLLGPESFPLGAPASMDSLLAYDITLQDSDANLLQLAVPLLPLSGDL